MFVSLLLPHTPRKSKPANLKGDDQGDHAESRTGRVTAGGKVPTPHSETKYPGKGEKIWTDGNKGEDEYPSFEDSRDAERSKGAYGTISKGDKHRYDGGTRGGLVFFFGSINLTLPTFAIRPSIKGVPCTEFAKGCVEI